MFIVRALLGSIENYLSTKALQAVQSLKLAAKNPSKLNQVFNSKLNRLLKDDLLDVFAELQRQQHLDHALKVIKLQNLKVVRDLLTSKGKLRSKSKSNPRRGGFSYTNFSRMQIFLGGSVVREFRLRFYSRKLVTSMNEVERRVDPRLWHACAGGMIQMPLPDSNVYYFPQGHAEHTHTNVDFGGIPRVRSCILCKVVDVKFLADLELQVYAKIMLSPLEKSISSYNVNDERNLVDSDTQCVSESPDKLPYFVKKFTKSDAHNVGRLRVPRVCVETFFPKLDCSADHQAVIAKDIHGKNWRFKHVYERSQRSQLLTTGWNTFVNENNLVAGNSVVFMRAENGDLCVGIKRAKLMNINSNGRGEVKPEDVIEAESSAANGQSFEITYYPHANTPEFVVKASSVNAALRVPWCAEMRFLMAFETEGLSRKSWFIGTVSSVQDVDPFLWPNSPWCRLQVNWDEQRDMLQNVRRVSPWLVELVSDMPSSSFPAGTQGARHAQFQTPLVNPNPTHKLELNLFPKHLDSHQPKNPDDLIHGDNDLTTGGCSYNSKKNNDKVKTPVFWLFGQPIHTDQQVSHSSNFQKDGVISSHHCEVFLNSEDVCRRTLDLSVIGSYEEVEKTLADGVGIEKFDDSTRVIYKDSAGGVKQMGDEPFSEFVIKAKRLTILMPS
ncbi:hypothetical protein L1987_04692 [Smallanthus sonchifolius]|uniref:Uncharacterized protein n=1 Tax=Smallanthus sonchifolius TaxID=185202 RepID=A0ACB9JTA1_9ASTR|nr:hypothetical protein L1987_04692 [Smallanthus sonchifolius]